VSVQVSDLVLVTAAALVVSLDTMVNIAFPAITARFDLGVERISMGGRLLPAHPVLRRSPRSRDHHGLTSSA